MGDYVADAVEQAGLRAYIAEVYSSASWVAPDGKRVDYEWDEAGGLEGFRKAVELIERIDGRANGRIRGFIGPAQIDNCTEELLRMSSQASEEMQVPLALHTSQAVFEFQEIVRRHGLTPVEWLESVDFLSDRCILGHVIYPAGLLGLIQTGLGIFAAFGAFGALGSANPHFRWFALFGLMGFFGFLWLF